MTGIPPNALQRARVMRKVDDANAKYLAKRSQRYVRLTGLADGTKLRTATFEDQEHVIVPVVMLVGDIVVWPMNRPGPEFVPASELEKAASSWNGRHVLPDHPNGGTTSANSPEVLESMAFGRVFAARFEDKKLKCDAWLNVARAEEVGDDATAVIDRVKAGEMVEVSVGAWVTAEESNGVHDGQRYEIIWRDIKSDHLALLPEGVPGACSIEDGCGAPRMNKDGQEDEMKHNRIAALLESLKGLWVGSDIRLNEPKDGERSDVELRQALFDAIRADEPGFYDIDVVYFQSKEVVYLIVPEEEMIWIRRSFKVRGDKITLNDDREEVEMVTRYEPVVTKEGNAGVTDDPDDYSDLGVELASVESIGEQQYVAVAADRCPCNNLEGEPQMEEKIRELVERLIECERSPFTEEDSEQLAGFSEERLAAMAATYADFIEPVPDPEPKPEPVDEGEPDPTEKTDEEWLAEAPESLRRMVERSKQEEDARRSTLVGAIAKETDAWSEDVLNEKTTEDLQALAKALRLDQPAPDFSARVVESPESKNFVRPPKPYTEALKARQSN